MYKGFPGSGPVNRAVHHISCVVTICVMLSSYTESGLSHATQSSLIEASSRPKSEYSLSVSTTLTLMNVSDVAVDR